MKPAVNLLGEAGTDFQISKQQRLSFYPPGSGQVDDYK
jgi:hypothetical protein